VLVSAGLLAWAGPASAETDGDFTYFLNGGTSAVIANYASTGPKDVVIPDTVTDGTNTYSVTGVGSAAFANKQLTSVTIPDSVTTIDNSAFGTNRLTSVTIPDSVTTIGSSAFSSNDLTSVTISDSVTTIGDFAFASNELTSVTLGDSVTTIDGNAFYSNQLTSVTLGDSVATIGGNAFNANPDLVSVVFEGNAPTVTDAGNSVESFDTASGSLVLFYPSGATGFSTPIWHGYTSLPQAPVVTTGPSDVSVQAGGDASFTAEASGFPTPTVQWQVDAGTGFVDLTGETSTTLALTYVTVGMDSNKYRAVFSNTAGPDAVTDPATLTVTPATDGPFTFTTSGTTATITGYAITGPKDVTIPATVSDGTNTFDVTAIGDEAFSISQLTSVTVPDSVITVGDSAFYGNELTAITIPDSVTTIDNDAFGSNRLTSVTFGDAVATIGNDAFAVNRLTAVTVPDSMTTIGDSAFYGNELTSVTLPDSVTTIGDYAFYDNQLTSVTLGDSVATIGSNAFNANPDLVSVVFEGNAPTVTDAGNSVESFDTASGSLVLFYPSGATGFSTPIWHGYTSLPQAPVVTTGPSDVSVQAGGDASFTAEASGFPTPTVQWQVDAGTGFVDLTGETSTTLALTYVTAGMDSNKYRAVFSNTAGPDAVTDPATLTVTPATDGPFTFTTSGTTATITGYDNTAPKDVTIPATVTDGTNTFDVTAIGDSAFADNQLTSVTIPGSVTAIGDSAFDQNPDLVSVVFEGNAPTVTDAGDPTESFDTASGSLVLSYPFGATGFTTPTWHGYSTETPTVAGLAPTITGLAQVGQTLTADPGPVDPADAALTYQWNADGDPISDATGSTYQLTTAEAGETITVTITATAPDLNAQTETCDPTAVVATAVGSDAPTDAALPDTGGASWMMLVLGLASILAGTLTLATNRRRVTRRH
jgi:electron transfer flavoprotein alpha subunit